MIASLLKAIGQLPDRPFRQVLWRSLAATLLLYLGLYAGLAWGLGRLRLFEAHWANLLAEGLGGTGAFLLSVMLFPSIATLILSFLLEDIAQAVEARHYPALPPPRRQGWGEAAWGALRFSAITLLANLLALPVTLTLLLFGIGLVVYYVINGYLLGRSYFELVAWRRLTLAETDALRRAHGGRLWLMGVALTFLSTLPGIALLAPLIGTATMLHELEALRPHPAAV